MGMYGMDEAVVRRLYGCNVLTPKLQEILDLVAIGKTNEEIGSILGISKLTVKNHVQHILVRLGVINRMGAVWRALQVGLLTPPCRVDLPKERIKIIYRPEELEGIVPDEILPIQWVGDEHLKVCIEDFQVKYEGMVVVMSRIEVRVMEFFIRHPLRVHTRQALLTAAWSADKFIEERVVDVYIRRIRTALGNAGADSHKIIQTIRGSGYRFSPPGRLDSNKTVF